MQKVNGRRIVSRNCQSQLSKRDKNIKLLMELRQVSNYLFAAMYIYFSNNREEKETRILHIL